MEAFSLSCHAIRDPATDDRDARLAGDFAAGLRRRPVADVMADFAAGMRGRAPRPGCGHFATGQSWHPQPYIGRGDFAVGLTSEPRVVSAVGTARAHARGLQVQRRSEGPA